MANKTVKDAKTVHGTNPQYLVEKIIRTRIYECRYWKEECFGLTADLVVDKGTELRYIGGIYGGNIKTTPFLCLTLKLLQIQPEKDIIIEFIRQENFKYVRALGAFYLRLIGQSLDIYKYLEPLYNDYRKLRRMTKMGTFDIIYMDEFIDSLLREDRVFDVILPRLTKRFVHEENGELTKRVSLIAEDLVAEENLDNDDKLESVLRNSDNESDSERDREKQLESPSRKRRDHSVERRRKRSVSPNHSRSRDHRHRRSRSQSRERSRRDRRHRDRSHSVERRSHRDRDRETKHKSSKKSDKPEKTGKPISEEDEISQMNALRAKLGLKPLRP